MKTFISCIAGIAGGLFLSVCIELKTGRCMAYHYDKVFHPNYIQD